MGLAGHLLVQVDGPEPPAGGQQAESVQDPVQLDLVCPVGGLEDGTVEPAIMMS